jgi:hypothetical protein
MATFSRLTCTHNVLNMMVGWGGEAVGPKDLNSAPFKKGDMEAITTKQFNLFVL